MVCLHLSEGGGIDWRRRGGGVEKVLEKEEESRETAEEEMEVKEREENGEVEEK